MKLAFSTLGCPEWSWDEMLATAKDLGFDGIEIRGIENEIYVPKAKPFLDVNIQTTKSRLEKLKLQIPCLTSDCYLFDKSKIDIFIKEGKEYIDLAEKLGTPFIRVLGDSAPHPSADVDPDFVAANAAILAQYAEGKNVKILIETNGYFSDSEKLLKLIEKIDMYNVGVLWDVHHPFRYMKESVDKTYEILKKHIMFVHVKDSIIENNNAKYKMMGYGDVPVKETVALLKKSGYTGFVSLEWVKRWCLELEEPGVVFSHFIYYMKNLTG